MTERMTGQTCAHYLGCSSPGTHPVADKYLCDACSASCARAVAEIRLEKQIEQAIQELKLRDWIVKEVNERVRHGLKSFVGMGYR